MLKIALFPVPVACFGRVAAQSQHIVHTGGAQLLEESRDVPGFGPHAGQMGHGGETAPSQLGRDGQGAVLPRAPGAVGHRHKERIKGAQLFHCGVKARQLGLVRRRKKFQGEKRRFGGLNQRAYLHVPLLGRGLAGCHAARGGAQPLRVCVSYFSK